MLIFSQSSRIGIVANDAQIKPDGSEWKPIWRHETELGHDKALSVKEGRVQAEELSDENEVPLIIFIGDGVSDLAAAREADVLFARKGLRLEEYCIEHQIPYIGFDSFTDVKKEVEKIMKEDQEKTGGVGKPARFNPRANMWRRVSSKQAVRCDLPVISEIGAFTDLLTAGSQVCRRDPIERRENVPLAGEFLSVSTAASSGKHGFLERAFNPALPHVVYAV